MAVTTKKLFPATSNNTTTVFNNVGIQLNNQDDLDVYVTLSGGTRVLQLRQSTGSTAQSSHPQVNNTDGLYFPAVSAGTTLYNYTLSTDNNTITFNSALPQGAVVFCERRTRDADSSYTTFASGSTIRATDLNNSSTESNFTAQDGRNKALTLEGVLFRGDQPSTSFITTDHIVDGGIARVDIANDAIDGTKIADDSINSEHYVDLSIDTQHIANENVTTAKLAPDAVVSSKIADNAILHEHLADGVVDTDELANGAVTAAKLGADAIITAKIADGAVDNNRLGADAVTSDKIADNAINSEHYVDGSIDREHLAADIVDGTKIADDSVNSEHIAAGALDNEHYAAGSITSDKLNATTVVTASEQATAASNDTSFLTVAAADARFFNVSTGDTIKDGDTFPDNDTTIATTAAINDRIIDLVDDVGGFVPVANETSFPTANPDINNPATGGTIVSVKAASTNLAPSGTTVTIANGRGSGLPVVITGVPSTIPSGFGFLVETTSTDHTYAFHRLTPKATEVTTVAGKATEIGRLGTTATVEDMSILGTTDVVADMAILGTADVVSDLNTLGTADVVADMNTLATSAIVSDMDTLADISANITSVANIASDVTAVAADASDIGTVAADGTDIGLVAGSITNVNTTAGSITNVNTVATNISSVNSFAQTYRIGANNPAANVSSEGDLFFNTTSDTLKVYTGSAWVDGVTQTGDFALKTGNTFTGSNVHNDNVKAIFGTASDGLEIYHNGNDSVIDDTGTGNLKIRNGGANKLTVDGAGIIVGGNITVSGNVDGRDVAADGVKLDGIETGATADQTASDIKTLLASDNLTSTHLAADSVGSSELADNAVDTNAIANGAVSNAKIVDGAINNAKIVSDAAIAGSKITPSFTGNISVTNVAPKIFLTDSDTDSDFAIRNMHGVFGIHDQTNSADRLTVASNGTVDVAGNLDVGAGVDVTGNITVSGTVDGRDVAADGTKLDGIEASATADQTSTEIKSLLASDNLTAAHLAADSVGSSEIAANAVGTSEIAADAVTQAEIANDAVRMEHILAENVTSSELASNAVTTAKIANDAVTYAKIQNVTQDRILGRQSSGTGDVEELNAANIRLMINVENGATADQSNSEIKTAYEANSNTNAFTDALLSKLNGIAASATNVTNTNQLTNGAGFITSANGGNAATLDSIDSSQFLRSDTADTHSGGLLTVSSGLSVSGRVSAPNYGSHNGGTVTIDFSSSNHHTVNLNQNSTFADPNNTSSAIGQSGSIFLVQDSSGSRTVSFHSDYKFAGGTAPTLSTTQNAVDRLDYIVRASDNVHCVVTLDVK